MTGQQRGLVVELVGEVLHPVVGQRDAVGVERVGLDHVCAGLEVLPVDAGDDLGLRQRQQIVVALHVRGPVLEPLTAVAGLVGAVALDRCTHGAVKHHHPRRERGGELVRHIGTKVQNCHR